jgi:hypothetical protein
MEGIETNRAKNAVNEKGVEGVKYIKELEPIEHLFEQFEKPIEGRMIHSYGILRRYYDDWKNTGEVPKFSPGRPTKEGMEILKATIPASLKRQFQTVVDKANSMSVVQVTYSDMVAVAIDEFIKRRPQFMDQD